MANATAAAMIHPANGVASVLVPAPDVLGLAELAELLDVGKPTAVRYAKRRDFPEPARLASGPVWSKREVLKWAAKTLPLREGRPPKRSPKPSKGKRQA